jgi:Abnormal spindle-like microcephaly-assoc'd, ASPM-SPD-2-Hydin
MRFPHLNAHSLYLYIAAPVAVFALMVTMFPSRAEAADPLTFSPVGLSFGDVVVGTSQAFTMEVINSGKTSVTITSVAASNSTYTVQALKLPQVVAAGGHLNVSVTFTPTTTGLLDAHADVVGKGFDQSFGLSGTGTTSKTQLTITPSTLNFGDVAVGGTGTQTAELSAAGGSVTVSSASSNSSLFALPGVVFPLTIASGKSVPVNVTFSPQKSGAASGTITFASNAGNSTTSDSVSGTGTTLMVSISWSASTSEGVTGYNVYRSTTPNGSYVKINSSLVKATNYTDTSISKGSYAYAATSVNSEGEESSYSSQIDVVVP